MKFSIAHCFGSVRIQTFDLPFSQQHQTDNQHDTVKECTWAKPKIRMFKCFRKERHVFKTPLECFIILSHNNQTGNQHKTVNECAQKAKPEIK